MSQFIRHDDNQRAPSRWAVSIFVGTMVACLFGFIAGYPKVRYGYSMRHKLNLQVP